MGPEKQFENRIKDHIRRAGGFCFKYWGGSASNGKVFTVRGLPDVMGCIKGRFLGAEIKAEHGKPSEAQLQKLQEIRDAGGVAILAYPQEEDLILWLINRMAAGQDVTELAAEINSLARGHYETTKNHKDLTSGRGGLLPGRDSDEHMGDTGRP